MPKFDPAALAQSWARPYTQVQRAWVDALGLEPSSVWRDERPGRRPDKGRRNPSREVVECFENRGRGVLL